MSPTPDLAVKLATGKYLRLMKKAGYHKVVIERFSTNGYYKKAKETLVNGWYAIWDIVTKQMGFRDSCGNHHQYCITNQPEEGGLAMTTGVYLLRRGKWARLREVGKGDHFFPSSER